MFRRYEPGVREVPFSTEHGLFPLTPALSLGEREPRVPSRHNVERPGPLPDWEPILPLPKGEGRGEGEGAAQKPIIYLLSIRPRALEAFRTSRLGFRICPAVYAVFALCLTILLAGCLSPKKKVAARLTELRSQWT